MVIYFQKQSDASILVTKSSEKPGESPGLITSDYAPTGRYGNPKHPTIFFADHVPIFVAVTFPENEGVLCITDRANIIRHNTFSIIQGCEPTQRCKLLGEPLS